MAVNGKTIKLLLWNTRQVFTLTVLSCVKKNFSIFYLMFPNIKKKSRFLHQLSQMRPCKAKCIQQSFPLQFCVIDRKLNGICLVEKFYQFTKKKTHQRPSNKHASQLLLCVYKLLYKLFKLGGTLNILAAQIYPAALQKAQVTVPTL